MVRWVRHHCDIEASVPSLPRCLCMPCTLNNSRLIASVTIQSPFFECKISKLPSMGKNFISPNDSNSRGSLWLLIKNEIYGSCCVPAICPVIHLPLHSSLQ